MDTRKHFDAWWSEHHKELRPEKVEEAAWMIWQAAATDKNRAAKLADDIDRVSLQIANAIMAPEAAEDLYARLHAMSKALESNGIIDETQDRKAYGAILDAMALAAKFL